jgi:phosphoserine phosphatase
MTVKNIPLIVDLDGTLTPADTLVESVLRLIKQSPIHLVSLLGNLLEGRLAFKNYVAENSNLSPLDIPYRKTLIAYLKKERKKGRKVILATASHKKFAEKVSSHLCLFDDVIATDGRINIKGENKLRAIKSIVGNEFSYAGDSRSDIPVWAGAKTAILVDVSPATVKKMDAAIPIEAEFKTEKVGLTAWLKFLHLGKWLNNTLLAAIIVTVFSYLNSPKIWYVFIVLVTFSLLDSASLIIKDLLRLENDRLHPSRGDDPLVDSSISIITALIISATAMTFGLILSFFVPGAFFIMAVFYVMVSIAYSWYVDQQKIGNTIMLSLFYLIKIVAFVVALDEPLSL